MRLKIEQMKPRIVTFKVTSSRFSKIDKRQKTHIADKSNETEDIDTNHADIKKDNKGLIQLHTYKFDNTDRINEFIDKYNLP